MELLLVIVWLVLVVLFNAVGSEERIHFSLALTMPIYDLVASVITFMQATSQEGMALSCCIPQFSSIFSWIGSASPAMTTVMTIDRPRDVLCCSNLGS